VQQWHHGLKDGVKGLMMYLLIKGKEESLDII
jgi:hypothetical protein